MSSKGDEMLLSLLSLWITTKQSPTCARGNEKTLGGYTQGGGWSNGAKSQDPKTSLGLPAKPLKKIKSPKNPMPILWPLKVPERGNAITQRKTLEIEHSCLFIHHTIWIYPFPHLILFNTPKKSLLKSSYPSQIFVPKKIPESKISNPKKSFHHPHHLKSWVPPPPRGDISIAKRFQYHIYLYLYILLLKTESLDNVILELWLAYSHHGIWAVIPCSPNVVTVCVCSKLNTSWKSVVFTNKVGKNSWYFVDVFNKTIITLTLVGHEPVPHWLPTIPCPMHTHGIIIVN